MMKKPDTRRCYFKDHGITMVDFRDTHILRKFIDAHGRVLPRSRTGTSAKMQRQLEQAIKRSRTMGFLPFVQR